MTRRKIMTTTRFNAAVVAAIATALSFAHVALTQPLATLVA